MTHVARALSALAIAVLVLGPAGLSGQETGLSLVDVDIMFVGAHPDDDGGILATFARYLRDEGYRGTVVTLTGGEGGGNAIGREAGRALGIIREEEERRSLALVGVDHPHFLGLPDFYFTLSAQEAERRWGGQGFVCDLVRLVRLRRPEVIVTMWPGPGTHGQHQMAARAATLAYARAGDPAFCPDQVTREFLSPFAPAKLYYSPPESGDLPPTVSVPTSDVSPSAGMRYADLKATAARNYRSQGYDRVIEVPAKEARPERFLLAASRVPVAEPETHLLAGALRPSGASPAGVRLEATPDRYEVGLGTDVDVVVRLTNGTKAPLDRARVSLEAPAGWTVGPVASAADTPAGLAPGQSLEGRFRARPDPASVTTGTRAPLTARYEAEQGGAKVGGASPAVVLPLPALRAEFAPTFDVAGYREFARATRTEAVSSALPTRVPVVVGTATAVAVEVVNDGAAPASGRLRLDLPKGVAPAGPLDFHVAAHARAEVRVPLRAEPAALPEGVHAARLAARVAIAEAPGEGVRADLYLLPRLVVPRVARPPVIDGDLADMEALAKGEVGPKDLWWRKEPSGPADLSASFRVGYDAANLYVGVHVKDDVVVCNIAPDDVKAQLRSDAVGITVDPSGRSQDTSTTLQFAAFPCTTAGFAARGFRDADARPGVVEETAPGTRVASRRTADGYDLEVAIPWSAMPARPRPGGEIGLNVVLYDGDDAKAPVGANVSESGLAWAAFSWGGKQALPYLWPRVVLGPSGSR